MLAMIERDRHRQSDPHHDRSVAIRLGVVHEVQQPEVERGRSERVGDARRRGGGAAHAEPAQEPMQGDSQNEECEIAEGNAPKCIGSWK